MGPVSAVSGTYNLWLVALSIAISILAAYAALDLAERVTTSRSGVRAVWLYGGATAMGIGIWAMHYVGMVALTLPFPVLYDWPTVVLSLLTAVFASAVALFIVSRRTMTLGSAILGSLIMGSGISAMHYIGMGAMRVQAICVYSLFLVALSVASAWAISLVALELAFAGRETKSSWSKRKLWSGLVMGLAIPVMHYLGMAAVKFIPTHSFNGGLAHATSITPFELGTIVCATFVILAHVEILSNTNRRFSTQAQQLSESEIQLKAIFDNLAEGIVVIDKQKGLVQINPAASQSLGLAELRLSLDELFRAVRLYTMEGEPISDENRPVARALRGDFIRNAEVLAISSGTENKIALEISTAPILNAHGEQALAMMTYREITERKRNEEANARLVAIVESSQDGIIGKDLNGIVTSWNKGAEQIFGYSAAEMVGESIQRLLPPELASEEDGILERLRQGVAVDHLETKRQRKDGQRIDVSLMISPIRDRKGRIVGASKIVRDITERRLLERQLRQSQKMEAIGQLTGGIAHDFNNLLAIVIGNLGLMERIVAANEAAMNRLRPAQKAASRGADLTRRLLALASKEDLNPSVVRLEDAIHETIELTSRALGPEVKIVTNIDPGVPPVFVDGAGLGSALLNLAVNARDAMPKGGALTIGTQVVTLDESFPAVASGELRPGDYARISVSDTGHGMSKETLERALEPFFTTKPRHKGTGLGLAMVYGFTRQSGGTVRLYSEEGYGTTVSMYLPLAPQIELTNINEHAVDAPAHVGGKVLVVDDEVELLEIACTYLSELGYTALRANDPATALSVIAQFHDIDLMVTDIIMPGGMNGVELAEKARMLNQNLKVIYSSGFPADALAERNGTRVDAPMLRKPYRRAEFAAMVQQSIEKNRT